MPSSDEAFVIPPPIEPSSAAAQLRALYGATLDDVLEAVACDAVAEWLARVDACGTTGDYVALGERMVAECTHGGALSSDKPGADLPLVKLVRALWARGKPAEAAKVARAWAGALFRASLHDEHVAAHVEHVAHHAVCRAEQRLGRNYFAWRAWETAAGVAELGEDRPGLAMAMCVRAASLLDT